MVTTQQLVRYLNRRPFYSFAVARVQTDLNTTRAELAFLVGKADVKINLFEYGGVEYIGLESRRLDYIRDEQAGTNPVTAMIDAGVYGPPTSRSEDIRRRGSDALVRDYNGRVVPLEQATVWVDKHERYVPPEAVPSQKTCTVL